MIIPEDPACEPASEICVTTQQDNFGHVCSQRLSCMSSLAGGIIHELHNAIGAIKNNLHGIEIPGLPKDQERHLSYIEQATQRLHNLAGILTYYTRDAIVELEPVLVRPVFEEALAAIRNEITDGTIRISWEHTLTGKHYALTNQTLLLQTLQAMLRNACEALMPENRVITLSLQACDQSGCNNNPVMLGRLNPASAYLCCRIEDTGCGIAPGKFPLIFDPFFTTKMRARGLGLAYAVGLVQQANAVLGCKSTEGEGSCFTLCLPAVA